MRQSLVKCTLQSAGRSLKKKVHRVSAQMYLQATVQDGVSSIHLQLLFFAAKVQISTSESSPKWRFRTRKTAATFSLFMHQYGRSFLLYYGVLGIYKLLQILLLKISFDR